MAGGMLAWIPVYALWALPTVGWLMLCSAWARSKPFLWAVMIPMFAGIFVSWFDLMRGFNLESRLVLDQRRRPPAAGHGPGHGPDLPRRIQ